MRHDLSSEEREEGAALLPDTHAHLTDDAFDGERDDVMKRAARVGVRRVLAVGSDLASSRAAVECAARYSDVYAAVGVHPHEAHRFPHEEHEIQSLLDAPKVVAIGEIGIDRRRQDGSGLETQLAAFRAQLEWARIRSLPVSVHNREADDEVLDMLSEHGVTAVLHCFSSPMGTARRAIEDGHYLSFAGNITFKRNEDLRTLAADAPIERLLIESDAPVLSPEPWRGRRNEPANVTVVCEAVSRARGIATSEFAAHVWRTAALVFAWGEA
jgi:TatD DNase family protein